MKKISFVLIALLALVAFTGCPTAHKDAEWSILTPGYVSGSITAWEQSAATKINWVIGAGTAEGSIDFTVTDPSTQNEFKVCDADWQNEYSGSLIVGAEYADLTSPAAENGTITGLVAGDYTFMLQSDSSTVKAKIVKK